MYLPSHFAETDVPALHEAMQQIGFGTLVTLGADGMTASHVPFLIEPEPAPFGTLLGHIARDNPQWRSLAPSLDSLAIFLWPQSYISPSWYPTKKKTGKVVPTWNYVAIHAYGRLSFFDDKERLLSLVTRLTERHEQGRAAPWAVSDAPQDFIDSMLQAIIGFALPIARLEGKWKMSQNRPPEDRRGAIEGLQREGGAAAAEVARLIAAATRG